jgi:hypothetical protein
LAASISTSELTQRAPNFLARLSAISSPPLCTPLVIVMIAMVLLSPNVQVYRTGKPMWNLAVASAGGHIFTNVHVYALTINLNQLFSTE